MRHRPKVHPGADRHHAKPKPAHKMPPHRGKGGLQGAPAHDAVSQFQFGRENAKRRPKSSEPDNVGRLKRPAAHNRRQSGVASRARKTVRKLSDQVI